MGDLTGVLIPFQNPCGIESISLPGCRISFIEGPLALESPIRRSPPLPTQDTSLCANAYCQFSLHPERVPQPIGWNVAGAAKMERAYAVSPRKTRGPQEVNYEGVDVTYRGKDFICSVP